MSYGLHGRKKVDLPLEVLEAYKLKEQQHIKDYQQLCSTYTNKKTLRQLDEEFLNIAKQILLQNPDYYTIWNDRRIALLHQLKNNTETSFPSSNPDDLSHYNTELSLVEEALKLRPKTYWIWNHRLWTLHQLNRQDKWQEELYLTDHLLNLDARNFHGWDYRRRVVGELIKFDLLSEQKVNVEVSSSPELLFEMISKSKTTVHTASDSLLIKELKYTELKIQQSFSNGSAWHYRSCLLKTLKNCLAEESSGNFISFEKEQNLVKNAFYTDPEDQSAWIYYQWLIKSHLSTSPPLPSSLLPQCFLATKKHFRVVPSFIKNWTQRDQGLICELTLTFPERIILPQDPLLTIAKGSNQNCELVLNFISDWVAPSNVESEHIVLSSRTWRRYFTLEHPNDLNFFIKLSLDFSDSNITGINDIFQESFVFTQHINSDTLTEMSRHCVALEREIKVKFLDSTNWELVQARLDFLKKETDELQELIDLEPSAKWPLQTLYFLNALISEGYQLQIEASSFISKDNTDVPLKLNHLQQLQLKLLQKLTTIDPLRFNYYQELQSKIQITS